MSKTHIQTRHALIWISRNFFISKRLCNIKSILRQLNEIDNHAKIWKNVENISSIQTYICLNVSQLFCIETMSQLQKNRSIKKSKLHTMRKRQIRNVFNNIWWFKRNSKYFNAKTKKCDENIHTNQSCFCFYIFAFFNYCWFHHQAIERSSINSRIFYDFFSKSNQSKWIFWIVNSLRLHLKHNRINHKFNFWFSKSSQKLRNKKKYIVFVIHHFDFKYFKLVWFVIQSQIFLVIFMQICTQFEICINLCFFNSFVIRRISSLLFIVSISNISN